MKKMYFVEEPVEGGSSDIRKLDVEQVIALIDHGYHVSHPLAEEVWRNCRYLTIDVVLAK